MGSNTLKDIIEKAYKNHIVIPAFNIAYLGMVKPIIEAIKTTNCFGLIEVSLPDVKKFSAKSFKLVKQEYDKYAVLFIPDFI